MKHKPKRLKVQAPQQPIKETNKKTTRIRWKTCQAFQGETRSQVTDQILKLKESQRPNDNTIKKYFLIQLSTIAIRSLYHTLVSIYQSTLFSPTPLINYNYFFKKKITYP